MSDQDGSFSPLRCFREAPVRTRRFAILGMVCGASVVGIGAYMTHVHHPGGMFVLVIGAAEVLLSLAIVPIAARRARQGLPENLSKMTLQTWLSLLSICLVAPGVADALDGKFDVSSAIFIALGCVLYVVSICIAIYRRRRRIYEQFGRQEDGRRCDDEAI